MIYFTDQEIDTLITEDVPYFDLTTSLLKLGSQPAKIQFSTRHETVICGTEEVLKIFAKFSIQPTLITPSGDRIGSGVKFFEAEGLAKHVHTIWRSITNLMEYASGIATRTRLLVEKAREINPHIVIATTRKTSPYSRKIAVKAVYAGGAGIHRLGLSESVVIFGNHYKFLGGLDGIKSKLEQMQDNIGGKTIVLEVKSAEDALAMADAHINVLQLDHIKPDELQGLVPKIKEISPNLKIAAAGGIREENIESYASSGVDILVSSWPYFGRPADFKVAIEPIYDY